jgi:hypothetical protein
MNETIRLFILHRHSLFRDLVLNALAADDHVDIIGATESQMEATRWVRDRAATAAIVEVDPGFASDDDVRALFGEWSRKRAFAVVGAGFLEPGIEVYLHRTHSATADDIAAVLSTALNGSD